MSAPESAPGSSAVASYAGLSGNRLTFAQTMLVGLPSFVLFGYNQAGLGGLLSTNDFVKNFPRLDTLHTTGSLKSHNSTLQGVVVSTYSLGALLGSAFIFYAGNPLGRKRCILIGAVLTLIGTILEASSFQLAQLVVGRTILGVGIGILNVATPVWQTECSKPVSRGKHVALDGAFISLGYLLTNWINYGFFVGTDSSVTWRAPIAIACLFSLILMSTISFMPESPRWLMIQGRNDEARKVLSACNGQPMDSDYVEAELASIQQSLAEGAAHESRFTDLFRMGEEKLFMRFMMCMALQCLQQMSGGNLISVYSTILYEENLGFSGSLARVLSAVTLTFKFFCGFIAFFAVDRFGRRPLLMISGSGMALCMACLAITTSQTTDAANVCSVVFIFLFNFFIPIGFLGVNWLYVAEVSPTYLRGHISALSNANNWIWNFVVTMITPVAIDSIKFKYYIIYAIIGVCIPIMVFFFFPETKGLDLERIDYIFRSSPSVLKVVATGRKPFPVAPEKAEVDQVENSV